MRIVSAILGFIGAIALMLRGFYIRSILDDPMNAGVQSFNRAAGGDTSAYDMLNMFSLIFIIAAALGALASILLLLKAGSPRALAILMLLAGLVPFINAESLVFGVPLVLAGILALFVRKKPA
ncbi:MAG: hypothetical protein CMI63_03945 [Parvularcula sp.]|nr:hypothetical protein [Parvularcula sp.]